MKTEECAGTRVIRTTLQAARANMGAGARRRYRNWRCAAPHAADARAGRLYGNCAQPHAAHLPLPYPILPYLSLPQTHASMLAEPVYAAA